MPKQSARAASGGCADARLSKLLRGRRGTEWAIDAHQPGETVLVLDAATLTRVSSLDEVGPARFYKAVSIGSDPSVTEAISFTNEAASSVDPPPGCRIHPRCPIAVARCMREEPALRQVALGQYVACRLR